MWERCFSHAPGKAAGAETFQLPHDVTAETERGHWARHPYLGLVCGSAQLLSAAHVSSAAESSQSDWTSGQRPLWSLWS